MDERHVRCFLGKGLKRQGDKRAGVPTRGQRRNLPTLEVARVDRAFFASSEYADDTTEGSGLLEEWEEVDNEPSAGIGY